MPTISCMLFPANCLTWGTINMAIVSYSQYHVNLVTLEEVKMLGSNFTFSF
jgi:hypothetical protein